MYFYKGGLSNEKLYGGGIYFYLYNQWCWLSPLKFWVWFLPMAKCTGYLYIFLCDKIWQWLAVFSINIADGHDITDILLKVALNALNP